MKKLILTAIGIVLAGVAYWAFSPLLFDVTVDDAVPTSATTQDTSEKRDAVSPTTAGPFEIEDTAAHPARGTVSIIETSEDTIVRYENYNGTNGPDLYVYLANDLEASEFVNLGRAKGNQGNINYTVPEDVNIDDYQYVLTWCKAFGVLFDYVQIN